jgi:hypothetical protein
MSITLVGKPELKLTYADPRLKSGQVFIRSAEWEGKATFKVTDEFGKTWRIGWVQVLEKNVITAIYKKTIKDEALIPGKLPNNELPVLDSYDNIPPMERPFYDKVDPQETHLVTMGPRPRGAAGPSVQQGVTTMYDQPESSYPWWHNGDRTDPLEEVVMNLQFSTWIAARDVTSAVPATPPAPARRHFWQRRRNAPPPAPVTPQLLLLAQWSVVLDRRFTFEVVEDSDVPLKADLTQTTWDVVNPTRQPVVLRVQNPSQPPAVVWTHPVANEVMVDRIRARGAAHVGTLISQRQKLVAQVLQGH